MFGLFICAHEHGKCALNWIARIRKRNIPIRILVQTLIAHKQNVKIKPRIALH